MYRFTLMLVRDHTERTGRDTRRRQVRKITLKALVSAQVWDWESAFELTDPISSERGWQLPAKVIYTFIGGRDPGQARIKQDTDKMLREMERIGEFDTWNGKNWSYSNAKLERVGEQLDQPTLEEPSPAIKDTVAPDLSGFECNYEVMAAPRVAR